jgi:hypothetical protein
MSIINSIVLICFVGNVSKAKVTKLVVGGQETAQDGAVCEILIAQ